jgi:hypothetical protein
MQQNGAVRNPSVSGDGYSLLVRRTIRQPEPVPVRPRAYAYARKHLLMYESVFALEKLRIASFANLAGYDLAAVFVEESNGSPVAFGRLLEAVIRDRVEYVILPSMLHFMTLGTPNSIKRNFEAATGAQVITAV